MSATAEVADAREAIDAERQQLEQNGAGRSIEDLAASGESGEQEELFPLGSLAGDPKTTLKNLVRAGVPTKLTVSISRAETGLQGGLFDFEASGEALVSYVSGKLEVVPEVEEKDGKRKLVGVKLRQNLRAVYVQPADQMFTREQVLDLLHAGGVSDAKVSELLG